MKYQKYSFAVCLCFFILIGLFVSLKTSKNSVKDGSTKNLESEEYTVYPTIFQQTHNELRNNPYDPTQLPVEAEQLKSFDRSEQESISDLFILLNSLRLANQGYFPTGLNIEVVNALLGKNYQKVAYLPDSHPRINAQGELTDKWHIPYHFHFISSKQVEIRSAGPDKELFTADDIVLGP